MSNAGQKRVEGRKALPQPPSRPLWKKILYLSMLLGLLYLAGEITLRWREKTGRWIPPKRDSISRANPYMRRVLVPGLHAQLGQMQIDINSLGFRGDEITIPKPPHTFRIFAIGESTTFGWSAASHRDAWPALLEAKLRAAHPDRCIEIVNAGLPGATSVEQRINFMLRISRLQPDAILIYHGNNDLNWCWAPDVETKQLYVHEAAGPPGWWERLTDHSYVHMWVMTRLFFARQSNKPKHDEPDPAGLTMLKNNLRGLIADARRLNVKAAIGTFAHSLDEQGLPGQYSEEERALNVHNLGRWFDYLSPQGARATFPVYNAKVRELAATEGIPLCDLAPAIPKTRKYHIDWCHFIPLGEWRVAELWFETLEKACWFQ